MTLTHTGHIRLSDGSVIRLDIESGHYVGTYYRPDMTTRSRVTGNLNRVQASMEAWQQNQSHNRIQA
jgi:hypothetical protein